MGRPMARDCADTDRRERWRKFAAGDTDYADYMAQKAYERDYMRELAKHTREQKVLAGKELDEVIMESINSSRRIIRRIDQLSLTKVNTPAGSPRPTDPPEILIVFRLRDIATDPSIKPDSQITAWTRCMETMAKFRERHAKTIMRLIQLRVELARGEAKGKKDINEYTDDELAKRMEEAGLDPALLLEKDSDQVVVTDDETESPASGDTDDA